MSNRCAYLVHDRCIKTGQPFWWVDLAEDYCVASHQQFEFDEREQALQYCADWVGDGMILEMKNEECQTTYTVKDSKVVPDEEAEETD